MFEQPAIRFDELPWIFARDGNDTARSIFKRHYSFKPYKDGRSPLLFVGPGEKLVLLSPESDALFVWRKFKSADGQLGVNCAVFRNESPKLSSFLIQEAAQIAWEKWPEERLYTYVNPAKLSTKKCRGREYCSYPPGRCFIEAGWRKCGLTKWNKLVILEIFPN